MANSPVVKLPTKFGALCVKVGENTTQTPPWVVIYKHPWEPIPLLRIHSSCLFSESLHSTDCDCALQLEEALNIISKTGGAIVYLYQEGRGHGLSRKAEAIATEQQLGLDTAEAFIHLGYDLDPRDYRSVVDALVSIDFPKKIRLATNNPRKVEALLSAGYIIDERVSLKLKLTERIKQYIKSKVRGLGHHESD